MKKIYFGLVISALAAACQAQFVASCDNWGYQGSATRYNTAVEAALGINAVGSASFAHRDGSLYMLQNRADYDPTHPDANGINTAWFYTTDQTHGAYSGWGNPNNTNDSFVQLSDDSQTRTSASGAWTDGSYTTFHLAVTGANADYTTSFSRLWDGSSLAPQGEFLTYDLDMTFTGLAGAVDGAYITSTGEPVGVSGHFKGIFWNNRPADLANNGFYAFDLAIDQSFAPWALNQNDPLNGPFFTSVFSAAPVPEPATMAALGLGALAMLRKRRRKSA